MTTGSSLTRTLDVPADTRLFSEREAGNTMYVIRSGRVKIFRQPAGREMVLAFLGPGDFFGEMALLEGLPRSASAITLEPTVLVEVDGTTFDEMIRRNTEIAVRMMRKLASRVRDLDRRLERLVLETALERGLEVLRWLVSQGLLEGDWIRIQGAAAHLDIAAQGGISDAQAPGVLMRLQRARCLRFDGDDVLVAQPERLEAYAIYLGLKRRYGPETEADDTPDADRAMKRLLKSLALSETQIEDRQRALAQDYERYQALQQKFGGD